MFTFRGTLPYDNRDYRGEQVVPIRTKLSYKNIISWNISVIDDLAPMFTIAMSKMLSGNNLLAISGMKDLTLMCKGWAAFTVYAAEITINTDNPDLQLSLDDYKDLDILEKHRKNMVEASESDEVARNKAGKDTFKTIFKKEFIKFIFNRTVKKEEQDEQ